MSTPAPSTFGTVALGLIELDPATQPRAELNPETVEQYAEHMRDGAQFPPVVLFDDGQRYWLGSGHHRAAAARDFGLEHIPPKSGRAAIRAEIRQGSREDAILYGLSANATLPRSNADKRRAVRVALELPKLAGKSDREIAAACAVSHTFVADVRRELSGNGRQMPERREVTRAGTTYTMDVSAIGKRVDEPGPEVVEEVPEPAEAQGEPADAAPGGREAEEEGRPEPGGGRVQEGEEVDQTRFVLARIKAAKELVDAYRRDSDLVARIDPNRRKVIGGRAMRTAAGLQDLARALGCRV